MPERLIGWAPLYITYFMWHFDTVLIMRQSTNGKHDFLFLSETYDRYIGPKKYESDLNLSEKL